ncbi:FAD-binding and (Fe-S)-binding domain-containing protein [Oerskovia sp. KBS0722]|uniref:FAD-binding and (Fe-S)-binding domain-containing protein n=1 Tax=Oerskovia sp. KBS0722 TaxID=1179673 RepID=UPI00110EC363|nr:FAD-binding and (Fe-S)-binding domain-containing protein [Oerskovia sp. KBS0722]QDW63994.1 FAD-binding oxidoreductase [Oerskovia sp. KBS0722]
MSVSAATTRALEIRTDLLTRVAQAHDASHYLLRPEAVARAQDVPDVVAAFAEARHRGLSVTFRSGGTSLSGQASGAGLLVDTRTRFTRVEVLDDGARVRCQPGVTLRSVNARLQRHGRRLGPDPASEIACTIGGVVANNSSGMACGTVDTAYRTIESMTLVLPSGTVLDTGAPDADEVLRALEPALHRGLAELRDRVRASASMRATIAHQYSMKNTMGYGVNAFVDHDSPVKILEHLVVGSEGTLAFVADVTFRTVPLLPAASTTLLVFDALEHATDALATVTDSGARAIELLDAASLRVAAADPLADASMRAFATATTQTALLVEYQATSPDGLEPFEEAARRVIDDLALASPAELTRDPAARGRLWRVRKGLYTAVAGARAPGSTALLEDLVVPVPDLTATVGDLGGLFERHGYDDAVTFGHAKDGNLHFMITPRLSDDGELDRFAAFTEDMVTLVLDRGGSLKAEHGTGRIMAPFVRRQFGDELYAVMREVKGLCDPTGLLNPGVLLTDDDEAHLAHLKLVPPVGTSAAGDLAEVVDRCVECGYCEPACPSRTVTTTPRQRIALLREMVTADPSELAELERAYEYSAVDTCAVDSLCVTACPVGIDTGKVMKVRRAQRHGAVVQRAGRTAADHWGGAVTGLRGALGVVDRLPTPLVTVASKVGRAVLGADVVPLVGSDLPGPGPRRVASAGAVADASVVFFQSCMGSLFSPAEASPSPGGVGPAFLALCERAGITVAVPEGIAGLCCGTPWVSKGLTDGAAAMAERTFDALWAATDGGRLPVVSDASSCTHGLEGVGSHLAGEARERFERLRVLDAVTFVRSDVLPALEASGRSPRAAGTTLGSLVLHPTCSSVHLGVVGDLEAVARAVADDVVLPLDAGCCGFAGDRGMLHPELTAAATRAEAAEVVAHARDHGTADAYASSNRTCEMGLSRATGQDYVHVVELLEEATRP